MQGVEEFKTAMQRLDSGMQRQVHSFLASWAADVKAEAMRLVPVRTGYLRSSIYAKIQEWVAEIGADATYALFVELGTKYMQAHPYLYPAIQQYLPELEVVIVSAIEQAKAEAGL
ncbi:MAG: HK97 gp10 family phage protein [Candidatus Bathyarchaeota archaeon]|nr:HK97 gp10 family phage protein [Candidatus Bathyarchaeota archaeon]